MSMRFAPIVFASAVLPFSFFACGGGTTQTHAVTVAASTSTSGTPSSAEEDRSPVTPPPGVIAQLHVAAPRAISKAIKAYVPKAKPNDLDARIMIGYAIGEVSEIVDIDAPIDVVAVQAGKKAEDTVIGYAFGYDEQSDLSTGLMGKHFTAQPSGGGVRLLVPKGVPAAEAKELTNCGIFPARGASSHRVVCVLSKGLGDVAPWLSRGVTERPPITSTARLEIDVSALRGVLGDLVDTGRNALAGELAGDMKTGFPKLDEVTGRLAKAIAGDLVDFLDDADWLAIEANAEPSDLAFSAEVRLSDKKSWIARALLADDAPIATAALGKLPGDGVFAAYANTATTASDTLVAPLQQAAADLVRAAAVDFAWADKDRDAALDLVRFAFPRAASSFGELGRVHPEPTPKYDTDFWLERLAEQPIWGIGESDRPVKTAIDFATSLGKVASSPAVKKTLETLWKKSFTLQTKATTSTPKGAKKDAALESTITYTFAPKKDKAFTLTFDEAIAGDDAHAWTAWSLNGSMEEARAKLAAAKAGNASPTFDASALFAALGKDGGFAAVTTIEGIARLVADPQEVNQGLLQLPDGGKAPIFAHAGASKSGSSSVATIALALPRDVIAILAY